MGLLSTFFLTPGAQMTNTPRKGVYAPTTKVINTADVRSEQAAAAARKAADQAAARPAPAPRPRGGVLSGFSAPSLPALNVSMPARASVPVPRPQTFAVAPAPLSAAQLDQLNSRQSSADEAFGLAEDARLKGTDKAEVDFVTAMKDMARSYLSRRTGTASALGGAGLALSPASMASNLNRLRENQAGDATATLAAKTDTIADLMARAQAAQRAVEATRRSNDAYRAQFGADLNQLLPGVKY